MEKKLGDINDLVLSLTSASVQPILSNEIWQCYGYKKRPKHGNILNRISPKIFELENHIKKELIIMGVIDILNSIKKSNEEHTTKLLLTVGVIDRLLPTLKNIISLDLFIEKLISTYTKYLNNKRTDFYNSIITDNKNSFSKKDFAKFMIGTIKLSFLSLNSNDDLFLDSNSIKDFIEKSPKGGVLYLDTKFEIYKKYIPLIEEKIINRTKIIEKSNLNVSVGISMEGIDTTIDFSNHHFVFITGQTGMGKSIFHDYLYMQLCSQNSPDEIGFILMDMTRHDFEWSHKSKYIISREMRTLEAIKILENLSLEEPTDKHIFIPIEECDMFVQYHDQANKAIERLLKNRKDITIIYSTSSPSERTINPSLLSLVDVKVVFKTARQSDQDYILGKNMEMPPDYCKVIDFDNNALLIEPVSLSDFYKIIEWKPEQ